MSEIRNPFTQKQEKASGNLLEEISDMEMKQLGGGTNLAYSRWLAGRQGIGMGRFCTISAECAGTRRCDYF